MEGKYIIHMPKGTTPRTRKILEQQQAAKGTGSVGCRWESELVAQEAGAQSRASNRTAGGESPHLCSGLIQFMMLGSCPSLSLEGRDKRAVMAALESK